MLETNDVREVKEQLQSADSEKLDKYRGCMIGGAAGDALGYAIEFLDEKTIFEKYGENGITEYDLNRQGVAEISDDTQMTLFTATGLLVGTTRGHNRDVFGSYPEYIAFSYGDWYRTQTEKYPLSEESPEFNKHCLYSWLANVPEMFDRRAPGTTCLSALAQGGHGTIEKPINNSKGCGGIMRVAPIGLYLSGRGWSQKEIDIIGAEVAALTHGHELGYIPAAMFVHIISIVSQTNVALINAVMDAKTAMVKLFPKAKHMKELISLVDKSIALSKEKIRDPDAIRKLGEGWVAEEALAIAIYCSLKYENDFGKAIVTAVKHSGDSDSTGSVVGNILGTHLGIKRIPPKYIEPLELKNIILEIADDLYNDKQLDEYGEMIDEVWIEKYIKITYK